MADLFKTVLADDFSNGYLTSNWGDPFNGGTYWNGAFTWSKDDVKVADGELQVTMTDHGGWWTAGGLNSFKAGQTITYGTMEFDARVEEAQGTMGAILTWPESDAWPRDGEIDILETVGNGGAMHSSHWENADGWHEYDSQFSNIDPAQTHHYKMTWLPDSVTIEVDGRMVAQFLDPAAIPTTPHGFGAMGLVGSVNDGWMGGAPDGSTPDQVTIHIDNVVMKQWEGNDGSVPAPTDPLPPVVTPPPTTGDGETDVNVLLRGQSNAVLFSQDGVWQLEQKLEAELGVDVHILTETHSGTAFLDWDTGGQQADLMAQLNGLSPDLKDNPTITVWMHNEYEQKGTASKEQWLEEVKADAALVREALGQDAATTPYVFVPVPYNYGQNWSWEEGMKELDADPAFNASMSDAFTGAKMDGDGYANSSHMGGGDQSLVANGLFDDLRGIVAELAKDEAAPSVPVPTTPTPTTPVPTAPTAPAGGQIDWAATSAAVTAHYEATGSWGSLEDFYVYVGAPAPTTPEAPTTPPVVPPPVVTPPVVVVPPVVVTPTEPTPAAPQEAGTGPDTLVLNVSGQSWQGDAKFTVTVDGVRVGGEFAATAEHGEGSNAVTLRGDWAPGQHAVEVQFVNDGFDAGITDWSMPQANDRNLHLDSATFNGAAVDGAKADLLNDWSPASFSFTEAAVPVVVPPVVTPPVVVPPVVVPPVVVTPPAEQGPSIKGGAGKDTLRIDDTDHATVDGGAGRDRIVLGDNADHTTLVFKAGETKGDVVTGFQPGDDLLEFSGFGLGTLRELGGGDFKLVGDNGMTGTFHLDGVDSLGANDYAFV